MKRISVNNAKTYILLIEILKDLNIFVGRLKNLYFKKGFYLYIGSAKRGDRDRIQRHLTRIKNIFWHIDYLLSSHGVEIRQIWITGREEECKMAQFFGKKAYGFINRFGSSDCRCKSHLFYVKKDIMRVKNILGQNGFKNADKNNF